jgi:hypothetical protein
MEYKYEDVEFIEAKVDFKVNKYDDDAGIIDTLVIKKGSKGVIESMGWSSSDNFRVSYDIMFTQDGNDIDVSIYEDEMEELLILS